MRSTALFVAVSVTILLLGYSACVSQEAQPANDATAPIDYARIDSGATVVAVSDGCNPPPYDVKGALGEGNHCSYPAAPPNWFIIDLGRERTITAIEIDWRYVDKSADDFNLSFGAAQDALDTVIEVRGIGAQGKYWYRVLEEPIQARFVKMEVLTLKNIEWTVINRLSLYGTPRIPRLIEQYSERYDWLAGHIDGLVRTAETGGIAVPEGLSAARARIAQLNGLLTAGEVTQQEWGAIESEYDQLLAVAYDQEAAVSFALQRRKQPDAVVWTGALDTMTHAFRHVWPAATAPGLSLECARNEWESGQIVLGAPSVPLTDVDVTWERLKGPVTLDDSALSVELVAYLKTEAAPYITHHIGWWPDGLTPLAPFSLPVGEVQPLWVTARIPANAPAGTYTSTISIHPAGLPVQQVPVTLTVWDFTLPTQVSLPNVFSLSQMLVESWYRADKLKWDDLKQTYYDFWLDRRLNPTSLYATKLPPPEDLDYCLQRGMNTFVLEYIYNKNVLEEEKFQALLEKLAAWDPILREKDLYDKALVYLADEPAEKQSVTDEINRRAGIIGERFPDMRRFIVLTRPVDPAFLGSVDVWCPSVSWMRPEDVPVVHDRGEKCWWYTVGAFYGLDRPLAESRSMPWLTFKHDLDGILLWVIQSGWRSPNKPAGFKPAPGETMWPSFIVAGHGGHNGIGNLCYPGADGMPWSSIRLELLRESMEDYEHLALLERTLAEHPDEKYAPLLSVPDQLAITYDIGQTGAFILDHRHKLGEALNDILGRRAADQE